MIRAAYDRDADALYVTLREGLPVDHTVEADEYRIIDIGSDGEPVGIEVLYPSHNLQIAGVARDHGFADKLNEIDAAVTRALGDAAPAMVAMSISYILPEQFSGAHVGVPSSGTGISTTLVEKDVVLA